MTYNPERRQRLGLALKTARQRAGLSASAASALIMARGLKCSRGTLLAWERGIGRTSREPFCSDLHLIASIYQCSVNDFFSNTAQTETSDSSAAAAVRTGPPSGDGQRIQHVDRLSAWHPPVAAALRQGANGA